MNILTADIGSTYTKLVAINTEECSVIATSSAFTTIETDVMDGFRNALQKLEHKIGSKFEYDELLCCSSAAGGLKMVALGLVPELTAKAAKLAASSAGAKVMKTYAFELSNLEMNEIELINPDLVLLCGGTDGGNKDVIIANASKLVNINGNFTTIVAGNKSASTEIENLFNQSSKPYVITENVMPEFNKLNIEPAKQKITELFINQIIEAKGLSGIQKLAEEDIIPTPLAVLNGCELLSKGTKNLEGLGELLAIDIGGATTDVYSIARGLPTIENATTKGLPEPINKRTVEGDLGMRYSLTSLVDEIDIDSFSEHNNIDKDEIIKWVKTVSDDPSILATPQSIQQEIEMAIAKNAVKIAVERHVGTYESIFTPFGQVFALTGKDLTNIPYVIGIGGAIINSEYPNKILDGAKRLSTDTSFAKPSNPKYFTDREYIFSAIGLLSGKYEEVGMELARRFILLSPDYYVVNSKSIIEPD